MASRTFTKTKTKTRTKQLEDESSGGSSTSRAETSAAGASKRYVKAGRSLSSTPLNTSIAISSSDEDDDFAADIVANIEAEQELRQVKKANGGRLPRKKQKESKSEKQTQHTRKLLREGQAREEKTAKWAIRERHVNPLVKLLNIEFTVSISDSESSSASEHSNESDTTKAYRAASKRRKKRAFDRKYGLGSVQQSPHGKRATFSSDGDSSNNRKPNIADIKGKGKEKPESLRQPIDGSATEDSDAEEQPKKVKKEEEDDFMKSEDKKPDISQLLDGFSDSDLSEDISPITNPAAYRAQLQRKQAKKLGNGSTQVAKDSQSSSAAALPRVKREIKEEDNDMDGISTPDLSRLESTGDDEDEDSDVMPDCSVTDPRYADWMRKHKGKGKAKVELRVVEAPRTFSPFQQRLAKPHFEVKSQQQASCGPLVLGFGEGGRTVQIPAAINRFLRGYQRDGVKFFWKHYSEREGGLLGDDMGLGKTIQVISFLAAIMGHECTEDEVERRREHLKSVDNAVALQKPTDLGPTALVIAPASVVDNWARELETWTYLSVGTYRPSMERRDRVLKDFRKGYLDVVICGIDSARNHIEELMDLDFSCIFVDEVHKVKNPASRTSIALQNFACKARFGLTGTAMQNRYSELHTVLDWCFPGRLGDRNQWKDYVESPLKEAQRKDATQQQLAIGRARAFALVHYLLPHFFIRRTKDLIADQLPKKTDMIVFCPLTDDQRLAYKRLLSHREVQIILTHDEPCPCGKTDDSGLPYARGNCCERNWASLILRWITIFTKVANHAVLIYPNKKDKAEDPEKFMQDQEIVRWAYQDTYRDRTVDHHHKAIEDMDSRLCGKWPILKDLLKKWHDKGDKVLLFSRSTRLLDALQWWIEAASYNMVRLDGTTPADRRLSLCDQFNDPAGGQFLFLISTLAGGVGLNLTAANRVVIFDPNWNPVSDLQAMDRSYRWGQTRDVTVYRLVGAGTIEELIYTRQIYKQHQAEIAYNAANPSRMFLGVQDDKRHQGELFGVKNLFRFTDTANRAKHSIEQAHISELSFELLNFASKAVAKKRKRNSDDEVSDQDIDEKPDDKAVLDVLIGDKNASQLQTDEDDDIARILRDNGVTYTHDHSALVKNSSIESKITKAALKDFQDVQRRGAASNQRASRAKVPIEVKTTSSWAPSKGTKATKGGKSAPEPDINPFRMLFNGEQVVEEVLEELAEALDFQSAASMARSFTTLDRKGQAELLTRAKEIVERL